MCVWVWDASGSAAGCYPSRDPCGLFGRTKMRLAQSAINSVMWHHHQTGQNTTYLVIQRCKREGRGGFNSETLNTNISCCFQPEHLFLVGEVSMTHVLLHLSAVVTVVWVEGWWQTGHWFLFACVSVYSVCTCTCVIRLLCGNASEFHTCSLKENTTLVQRNEPLSHMSFNSDFIRYTEKLNTVGEPLEWRAGGHVDDWQVSGKNTNIRLRDMEEMAW